MKHCCKTCNKLLAIGAFTGGLNIKCPRCHVLNSLNLFSSLTTENAHERHISSTREHETHGQTAKTLR